MTDRDPSDRDATVDHRRIVVDADVLAADLLCGGAAREALDCLRRHSWLEVVATEPLLEDAEAVIAALADDSLAADWRAKLERWDQLQVVDQPAGDHPALAAAYRGEAAHLVSMDDDLLTPRAGVGLRAHMDVSVRSPEAFVRIFDPAVVYELAFDDAYPGPDRDPRT